MQTILRTGCLVVGFLLSVGVSVAYAQDKTAEKTFTGPAGLLEQGEKLYDDQDFFEAAKLFFQVVEDQAKEAEPFRQKAEFFLGKSLYNLDYLNGSLAYFQRIAQTGPDHSYYRATLQFLAALADRLPDDGSVLELIGLYTTEDFPEKYKEDLSYLLGKYLYFQNNRAAALVLLSLVTPESKYYLEAKFYEAALQVRENNGKLASEAYKDMLRYINDIRGTDEYLEQQEEIDRLEDLVELSMGRVFYSTQQYQTSIKYFDSVEITNEFWLESLSNLTWAYFQINGYDRALGHIHTLNSPFFEGEFYPESLIVKSVIHFYNCRYDEAEAIQIKFEETYDPVEKELGKYLEKFDNDEQFYTFVAKFRRGKVTLTPRIQRVVSIALGDKALLKQFDYIEDIDKEQKQLKLDKKDWGESPLALRLEEELDISKTFAIGEAGAQVKTRFQSVKSQLNELIRDGLRIKFEVNNAQANNLEAEVLQELAAAAASAEATEKTNNKKALGLFVDDEHILWSFDREYWKDELGYYRAPITSLCKQSPGVPVNPVSSAN